MVTRYFTVYNVFRKKWPAGVHSVGVFMLIRRAKVRPGAAGWYYGECSDWLLQIAALIRYAPDVKSRERQMYLAVLAAKRAQRKPTDSLISGRGLDCRRATK